MHTIEMHLTGSTIRATHSPQHPPATQADYWLEYDGRIQSGQLTAGVSILTFNVSIHPYRAGGIVPALGLRADQEHADRAIVDVSLDEVIVRQLMAASDMQHAYLVLRFAQGGSTDADGIPVFSGPSHAPNQIEWHKTPAGVVPYEFVSLRIP